MAPPKKVRDETPTSTALVSYDEDMAKEAAALAKREQHAGGGAEFFSLQGGQLKIGGNSIPNNQVAAIILDSILENVFYVGKFDPANPAPPKCFAYGTNSESMEPHETVKAPELSSCADCPNNEWGSADQGRGKACRNTRRLALLAAGTFDDTGRVFEPTASPERLGEATLAYLKLPVTSVKAFANYVRGLATSDAPRPPRGVYTRIKVVPDATTQFKLEFTALGPVPSEFIAATLPRRSEAALALSQPYPEWSEPAAPPPRAARPAPAARPRFGG